MRNGIQFPTQVSDLTGKLEKPQTKTLLKTKDSFKNILESEIQTQNEIRFSAHAVNRLEQRQLKFSDEQMKKITQAVNKAADKGAKEALILSQDMALIVNIKNRTIITAMDKAGMQENVFTNIDSAIVV